MIGYTNSRKEYNKGEQGRKHSVRIEGQRTFAKNLEVEGKIYIENTPVKEGDQGGPNSGSTPVERKRLKKEHGKMRRYLMKSQHTTSGRKK